MKNGHKFILTLILMTLFLSGTLQLNTFKAVASEYYSFSCGVNEYEVSYIKDDGNFEKESCHKDYASANSRMKELGEDYVVRSASSLSPTKIVSMVSGMAYSYPARSGSSTMNIYEHPSDRSIYTKTTYVTNHWEMTYHETERVLSDGKLGMIKVSMNGFEGYADLENTDLVPSKYIEKSIAIYLGGNDTTGENEQPFMVIPRQKYYEAVDDGNYVDLVLTYHQMYPRKGSSEPVTYTSKIGPAPSFMKPGLKYYSSDGIHYYSDTELKNYVGTDYSYYQYLPLRSKTNISAPQFEAFLKNTSFYNQSKLKNEAQNFIDSQDLYGCNALLVYALACHESLYGTSNFAIDRNNLFGWNAFDSDPNQASHFESISQSIKEQMGINLRGFIDVTDGRFFNSSLGNKGSGMNVKYASDPYWGVKIAAIAYNIDKFANNYNGNLSDFDKYDLALVDAFDIDVKQGPGSSTTTLYKTGYGGKYQKDFIVIKLGEVGSYTKIQSTNAIDENGNIKTHRTPITTGDINPISTYDFNKSAAYILSDNLVALNYEKQNNDAGKYIFELNSYGWNNDLLHIEGKSYVDGYKISSVEDVEVTFELIGSNESYYFVLDTSLKNDYEVSFIDDIDIKDLKIDTYKMKIVTTYSSNDKEYSSDIKNQQLLNVKNINGKQYSFLIDNSYNTISVSETRYEANPIRQSLYKATFDSGVLKINGIAVLDRVNIINEEDISHKLVLIDKTDRNKVYEFELNSIESKGFSLNDGYTYNYPMFEGEIDLNTIEKSTYDIYIDVKVGNIEKRARLFSTMNSHNNIVDSVDNVVYRLTTNQIYAFAFELDIMNNNLDFDELSKPTLSNTLFGYDTINVKDGVLNMSGYGMIYKTNYPNNSNKKYHQVYLVADDGKSYPINTESYACEVDYALILGSDNNLDNMCFRASTKLDSSILPSGHYRIYLGITSDNYNDIVEFSNPNYRNIASIEYNGRNFVFNTSSIRDRIELTIEGNE